MKKPIKTNIRFKDYSPDQIMLLPPSLEELIDANHPVRIVNQVIEKIDLDPLFSKYIGQGPDMMGSNKPMLVIKCRTVKDVHYVGCVIKPLTIAF